MISACFARSAANGSLLFLGIWHGANFTFIAWGLFYAVLQLIERLFLGKLLKKNPVKIFNWIYTMAAAMLGWIYFRSDTIFQANEYVRQLFNFEPTRNSVVTHLSMLSIIVIIFGILFSGFVQRPVKALLAKIKQTEFGSSNVMKIGSNAVIVADICIQLFIVVASCATLVGGSYNAFIYFQF